MFRILLAKRAITKVQAVVVAAIIIVAAIIGAAAYMSMPVPTPAPTPVATIKIGCVYSFTGPLSMTGRDAKQILTIAEDWVNGRGGIKSLGGAKINLIWGDAASDDAKGAAEVERLITEEKVIAIQGCWASSITATASQVAERYGVPFICDVASATELTERGFKWFFRVNPSEYMFAERVDIPFFHWLKEKFNFTVKKLAILYENTAYGKSGYEAFTELADKYGLEVVLAISYSRATTDVTSEVMKLKSVPHDALIMYSYINDAILYVKTFKSLGYKVPLAIVDSGGLNVDFLKALGKDAEYLFNHAEGYWDMKGLPLLEDVTNEMMKRFGVKPNHEQLRELTAFLVLVDAIERAGSLEPEKIRDALLRTSFKEGELPVPWGVLFDPTTQQNVLAGGGIVQQIDAEPRTVFPEKYASATIHFPIEGLWPP